MIAPSARRVVIAAAAAALTGTAAFGQQFASLDDERRAFLTAQCAHITDGARQVGCMAEKSIEFSRTRTETLRKEGAEHKKAIESAKAATAEADCSSELAAGLRSGDRRFAPERGKAILNGKHPREFGYCNLRDALTKS